MADHYDVLSHHDAICEFTGLQHIPCRFMTSLCPDRCDHATDVALFKVLEYKVYEKKGQYGDEKQEVIRCDIKKPILNQDPKVAEVCKTLKPGQKCHVVYDHLYVTKEGSKFPVRPVLEVTPLDN